MHCSQKQRSFAVWIRKRWEWSCPEENVPRNGFIYFSDAMVDTFQGTFPAIVVSSTLWTEMAAKKHNVQGSKPSLQYKNKLYVAFCIVEIYRHYEGRCCFCRDRHWFFQRWNLWSLPSSLYIRCCGLRPACVYEVFSFSSWIFIQLQSSESKVTCIETRTVTRFGVNGSSMVENYFRKLHIEEFTTCPILKLAELYQKNVNYVKYWWPEKRDATA